MNNAEKFLEIYNKVEKLLTEPNSQEGERFKAKIEKSTKPVIQKNKQKLKDYGDLRNAIVHNNKIGGNYIAIPLDEVVKSFEDILATLENPPRVFPRFKREVKGTNRNEKLNSILGVLREKSYSQMPIFDNDGKKVIEIINTNTIARWLGRNINYEGIMEENPTVDELFQDIEFNENYEFVSREWDIYTAHNFFTEHLEKNSRNLDAIFITQNGRNGEALLGLITVADITELSS